jgi:hypothetical protein
VRMMNDHAGLDSATEDVHEAALTPINCPPVNAGDESLVRLSR